MITRTYPSSTDLAVRAIAVLLAFALSLFCPVETGAQNPRSATSAAASAASGQTFKQEELDSMLPPSALGQSIKVYNPDKAFTAVK